MYFEEIKQGGPWPYGGAMVMAVKPFWWWRWSWWVEGSPHPSQHSLLCTLLRVYEALCVTRKESFVSLLKRRTFEVSIGRIPSNWACWLHPSPSHLMWTTALQAFPVPSKNILWPCWLAVFWNVILNLQKREPWKCRLSIPVRLDAPYSCEIQSTIVVTGACC